jgi:hypothetical protein
MTKTESSPDRQYRCGIGTAAGTPLVSNRPIPQDGSRTAYVCVVLASPALWRWRKYTVFPGRPVRDRLTARWPLQQAAPG